MIELDAWLRDLRTQPVPGGVAAAAVVAAMGTALAAKAIRVTLERQSLSQTDRSYLQEILDLAIERSAVLRDLSDADTQAFRAVLDLQKGGAGPAAARQGWLEATSVPVRIAEECRAVLVKLPHLLTLCWPAVYPDLRTGMWLLEASLKASLFSAESNLRGMGDTPEARALQERVQRLQDGRQG